MSIQNIFICENDDTMPVIDNSVLQGGVTLTRSVNSGDNLLLGSCCAAKAEFNILDLDGAFQNLTGKEFLYTCNGEKQGYFIVDSVECQNDALIKVTAYDRMILFDITVDDMITALPDDFTLSELYTTLCSYVGIEPQEQEITNGDFSIKKNFTGSNITGRDMLYWIAEVAASYAFINADGKVELGFYNSDNEKTIDRDRYFTVNISDFKTSPINKLQIHKNENDIGCIVQTDDSENGTAAINAYTITDNPLFYTTDGTTLETPAQAILEKIQGFCYVPFECELLCDSQSPNIGDLVIIKTQNSDDVKSVVMEYVKNGMRMSVSATGSEQSNNLKSKNRSLLATNLRTNELIRTLEGTVSTVTHISTKEDELEKQLTALSTSFEQTAEGFKYQISKATTNIDELQNGQRSLEDAVAAGAAELHTTTVDINDEGIQVGSSSTALSTKMTPETFEISNGSESRIAVSNRETKLQKTVIEDDLTVGCVKMIDRTSGIDFVVLEENDNG